MVGGKLYFMSECGDGFLGNSDECGDTIKQACKDDGNQAKFCTLLSKVAYGARSTDVRCHFHILLVGYA
jgi:hypothetical protein